jgi:beta-lactamase superfamily II metal-dependent hydrolase
MTVAKRKTSTATTRAPTKPASAPKTQGSIPIRVRMYRIGFGDFFLVSFLRPQAPLHVLIDCGVHAGDIGAIQDAVKQLQQDTGSKLALLIMTHRHADHISGFASCRTAFAGFTVERIWMSWFEDPGNKKAMAFQASLAAVAQQLRVSLALRASADKKQLTAMADNILGLGAAGVSNQAALDVLHGGFANRPPIDYYQAKDTPTLPDSLLQVGLAARILGPPIDPSLVSQMTNTNQQYLAAAGADGAPPPMPFARPFWTSDKAYPSQAFRHYGVRRLQRLIAQVQPDALAARAAKADNTLNNQSLVVLFSLQGRNLLFAGDAQWGNWENFLYGGVFGTSGHTELTDDAKAILQSLNFYKVGHHGSANASPKGMVEALRQGCAGMCSTQERCYNGVPKGPLLDALRQRMNNVLARSDQVAAGKAAAEPDAGKLPAGFTSSGGKAYIDYQL